MPACFQLIDKTTGKSAPLVEVDEKMCFFLGIPVHPQKYCLYWYDVIGFKLATGKNFSQIREELNEVEDGRRVWNPDLVRALDWMQTNYDSDAFYQRK